jgi:hypothetical protein
METTTKKTTYMGWNWNNSTRGYDNPSPEFSSLKEAEDHADFFGRSKYQIVTVCRDENGEFTNDDVLITEVNND